MGTARAGQQTQPRTTTSGHKEPTVHAEFDDFELRTPLGGLILLGPTTKPLSGLAALLSSPEAEAVEVSADAISNWGTATAEVTEITRQASRIIRRGRAAVVHLDAHVDASVKVSADSLAFICARLGQIMIGLADYPAYVAVHGNEMAQALVDDSLGDTDVLMLGTIGEAASVVELTNRTMFPGIPVAVCPGNRPVTAVAQVLDWFEARRE